MCVGQLKHVQILILNVVADWEREQKGHNPSQQSDKEEEENEENNEETDEEDGRCLWKDFCHLKNCVTWITVYCYINY